MRVALVTSGAQTVANFRGPLIRELRARGASVLALAPDYDPATRGAVAALGAEPIDFSLDRTGMRPARDLVDMVRLAVLLRRLKPDAVLNSFAKPVIFGGFAAAIARVPRRIAMLEGLGYVYQDNGAKPSVARRALRAATHLSYRAAFGVSHRVVFLNREDRAVFVDTGALAPEKAVNIGAIGVDLDDFRREPPVTEPVTFLLMARLLRDKGIVEYAEAARLVRREAPATRFVLLGGLDSNPTGLKAADIEGWVHDDLLEWPGHVPDVRDWIARSSVVVLPSYYREGVPRSLQEAAAMGRPIVTTDNIGCRDTVDHGLNGFLVPIRTAVPLAEAMLRFVREPGLIASMGMASRRVAEKRFDAREANRRLLALLMP